MMTIDLVTITFNSEMHLRRCLDSVRSIRKYINNFIIIDGKSTDNTLKIVDEYSDVVSECISEPDSGISDAFNKGIKKCTSDFILLLNSDDWILEENIVEIINLLDVNDEVVCTKMLSYYEGSYLGSYESKPHLIRKFNSMLHPGCIISSSVYRKVGRYDLSLKVGMDYDFFCRCFVAGVTFRLLDLPLVAFHEGGVSRTRKYLILRESFALRRKYHGALFPLHEAKQLISRFLGDALDSIGWKLFVKNMLKKI